MREPEAGAAADVHHGAAGHLPQSPHQPAGAGAPGLSLTVGKGQGCPAQPGVGRRHHLLAHGPWIPLPGVHPGLAQPVRGGLVIAQQPGGRLLRRRFARGAGAGPSGGLQHRPGQSIHQPVIRPGTAGTRGQNQHGREGAVHRQHLRGTVVAHGEVRGGVPESLPPTPVNPGENWAPASGSTTARDLISPWATGHRPRCSTWGPMLERRGRSKPRSFQQTRRWYHWQERWDSRLIPPRSCPTDWATSI